MHCALLQVRCGGWLDKPALVVGWRVDLESLWLQWRQWWKWNLYFFEDSIVRCVLFYCIKSIVLPTVAFPFLPWLL